MIKIPKVATLLLALILSGCQSTPTSVVLNPQLDASPSGAAVQLQVRDQRAHNYIMRVNSSEDSAEFATADPSLASLISTALGERWVVSETASESADVELEVIIRDALFVIKQGSLRHDTEHTLSLQTKLSTPTTDFEKTFNGSRTSNGPLRADRLRVSQEFSELLATVLSEIANDEALNRHIQEALSAHIQEAQP